MCCLVWRHEKDISPLSIVAEHRLSHSSRWERISESDVQQHLICVHNLPTCTKKHLSGETANATCTISVYVKNLHVTIHIPNTHVPTALSHCVCVWESSFCSSGQSNRGKTVCQVLSFSFRWDPVMTLKFKSKEKHFLLEYYRSVADLLRRPSLFYCFFPPYHWGFLSVTWIMCVSVGMEVVCVCSGLISECTLLPGVIVLYHRLTLQLISSLLEHHPAGSLPSRAHTHIASNYTMDSCSLCSPIHFSLPFS